MIMKLMYKILLITFIFASININAGNYELEVSTLASKSSISFLPLNKKNDKNTKNESKKKNLFFKALNDGATKVTKRLSKVDLFTKYRPIKLITLTSTLLIAFFSYIEAQIKPYFIPPEYSNSNFKLDSMNYDDQRKYFQFAKVNYQVKQNDSFVMLFSKEGLDLDDSTQVMIEFLIDGENREDASTIIGGLNNIVRLKVRIKNGKAVFNVEDISKYMIANVTNGEEVFKKILENKIKQITVWFGEYWDGNNWIKLKTRDGFDVNSFYVPVNIMKVTNSSLPLSYYTAEKSFEVGDESNVVIQRINYDDDPHYFQYVDLNYKLTSNSRVEMQFYPLNEKYHSKDSLTQVMIDLLVEGENRENPSTIFGGIYDIIRIKRTLKDGKVEFTLEDIRKSIYKFMEVGDSTYNKLLRKKVVRIYAKFGPYWDGLQWHDLINNGDEIHPLLRVRIIEQGEREIVLSNPKPIDLNISKGANSLKHYVNTPIKFNEKTSLVFKIHTTVDPVDRDHDLALVNLLLGDAAKQGLTLGNSYPGKDPNHITFIKKTTNSMIVIDWNSLTKEQQNKIKENNYEVGFAEINIGRYFFYGPGSDQPGPMQLSMVLLDASGSEELLDPLITLESYEVEGLATSISNDKNYLSKNQSSFPFSINGSFIKYNGSKLGGDVSILDVNGREVISFPKNVEIDLNYLHLSPNKMYIFEVDSKGYLSFIKNNMIIPFKSNGVGKSG